MNTSPVVRWNLLRNSHVNSRDGVAKCKEVMAQMRKDGVKPNVTSWNTLMNAHVNARDDVAKCEELLVRMRAEGLKPNIAS